MSEKFNSEQVEVSVEKKKGCIVNLNVKASKDLVADARKKAIKDVNKEVSIAGFRKGKAPEEMIIKQYGSNVEAAWKKKIADLAFVETQKLIKMFPLNSSTSISFDLKSHSLDDGAELFFSFETEPTMPSVDPKKYTPKKIEEKKVTDKEVDEALRQSQFFFANFNEVERPIKEDDYVILDLESLDTEPPTKVFSGTRFEIKDKSIANWMKELLLGAKKGDVLEGISKPDEDVSEEEKKKFEEKKVRVTITKVEETTLPELNDDFAKKMGSENVEKLKENIKKMLENQNRQNIEKQMRGEVNKFLVETYDFDKPESLLTSEIKYRKDQMLNDKQFKMQYDKMSDEEKQDFEKEIERQANDAIALFYLSRKIVDEKKINITKEEIQEEVNIFMSRQMHTSPGEKPSRETYALCLSKLIMQKAQDYILENCNKIDTEK